MDGAKRREAIVSWLEKSNEPVSGSEIAKKYGVSRQVIVQDIALIRSSGREIYSTHRGYVIDRKKTLHTRFQGVSRRCGRGS